MDQEQLAEDLYYVYGLNGSTGTYLDEPLTPHEAAEAALEQVEKQSEAAVGSCAGRTRHSEGLSQMRNALYNRFAACPVPWYNDIYR
jgi:hypothetical protein